tara:strand:+ start:274 stop:462 length:189 start_codon:yes stop_codon:yes gene_type:complete
VLTLQLAQQLFISFTMGMKSNFAEGLGLIAFGAFLGSIVDRIERGSPDGGEGVAIGEMVARP